MADKEINKIPIVKNPNKVKTLFTITFTGDSYKTQVRLSKPKTLPVEAVIMLLKQYIHTMEGSTNGKKK